MRALRWRLVAALWMSSVAGLAGAPLAFAAETGPSAPAVLAQADRIRLAEAFRMSSQLGDRIWPGWTAAPFAVLLVTQDAEFLIRHPKPTPDFTRIGHDELLDSDIYRRPRQFPTNLQATFPAVADIPTVVIGTAENTASKTSTPWVVTVMHEHFHQLQTSQPGYFAGVDKLDLKRGDTTGMWMLNFAFPYTAPGALEHVRQLATALAAPSTTRAQYAQLRSAFNASLQPDEARYFGFQLWQEGVARYTEIRIADWAATSYTPSPAFAALPDYQPFAARAQALHARVNEQLAAAKLADDKRVLFYAIGAAEGLLLDRTAPGWQARYFAQPFDTLPYFATP